MSEEKGARTKDEIYRRIAHWIALSESAVKKLCLKAKKGENFKRVLDLPDDDDWVP